MIARDRYTFGDDAESDDDDFVSPAWVADVYMLLHPRPERDVQLSLWEARS